MKSRIWKRLIFSVLTVIISFSLLMMTPRLWSALNPEKPPVGYHFLALDYLAIAVGLEDLIDRTPAVPQEIEEIKNIEYKNINGKSLQLDLYKPKNLTQPAPLLVFIVGGGWKSADRAGYLVYLLAYAKKGYVTATVSYRVLEDGPYPACVEDISDAVQWFFRNGETYGYDPDRIALIGGSAGGYLAMMAAYEWENDKTKVDSSSVMAVHHQIKAVVNSYGPCDLTTGFSRTNLTVTNFLAHTYAEAPELFTEASPIRYLDKNDPPTMILHGTSDQIVPISQSDELKAKLDSLGVPNVYYKAPLWPHTMEIVQRVNVYAQLKMDDFFEKYLK